MLMSNTNFIRMWTHCTVEKVESVNKKVLNHSCHWKTNSVEFAASRDFGLELNCKNLTAQDRKLFRLRQTWHVLKKKNRAAPLPTAKSKEMFVTKSKNFVLHLTYPANTRLLGS